MEHQSLHARLQAVKKQAELNTIKRLRSGNERQSLTTFKYGGNTNGDDATIAYNQVATNLRTHGSEGESKIPFKIENPGWRLSTKDSADGVLLTPHSSDSKAKTTNKRKRANPETKLFDLPLGDACSLRKLYGSHKTVLSNDDTEEEVATRQPTLSNGSSNTKLEDTESQTELTAKQQEQLHMPKLTGKKKSNTPSVKAEPDECKVIVTRTTSFTSEWYQEKRSGKKQKLNRSDLENLKYINTLIRELKTKAISGGSTEDQVAKIRLRLHQMSFYDFLSKDLLVKSRVLEGGGLVQIFEGDAEVFPWDIRDDSRVLYQRWMAGKLDPSLLIGIQTFNRKSKSGRDGISRSLDRDYKDRTLCNYQGEGSLTNGMWWPLQLCALRDGAHGEIEAGIHGCPNIGAFSIVLSGGGYQDVDEGEVVKYCGTHGSNGAESANTQCLMRTYSKKSQVRLLRSHALPPANKYRPLKGIRYDGVYVVREYELLNAETAMHRFTLVRVEGQGPIRFSGVEKRPTEEEMSEYRKIRDLSGLSSQ